MKTAIITFKGSFCLEPIRWLIKEWDTVNQEELASIMNADESVRECLIECENFNGTLIHKWEVESFFQELIEKGSIADSEDNGDWETSIEFVEEKTIRL